jgi:signal transduction histidine kinase/ActR/RegA family two-component response regulator
MEISPSRRLLSFARVLQQAATFGELLQLTRAEAMAVGGYQRVWLCVADREDPEEVRLLDYSGSDTELVWAVAPVMKVKGDRMLEEILASDGPVVIEDARTDPRTNKAIVEALGNRTIINIPLRLLDKPFGFFGTGTFGDEGCRPPTSAELDYLSAMASQISVAASRIRFLEERARVQEERQTMERRLFQIQKLESLGLLAGGIAHDFNNLLMVILSGASLAEEATRDPEARADIRVVIDAAERGRDLTRQLLALSRAQELTLKSLDMNERLQALVQLLRRVLPETISVDLIPGARLPLIEGDASQLDQVFMNLCINARDAMPTGGRLTIETEQVVVNGSYAATHPWAQPGRYVLVTVTDTGIGMPRDILERIFEPFFTTKKESSGTGLGLAVSYGIVRQHGGMLNCYSELNVGTTFKVYLPVQTRPVHDVGNKIEGAVATGTERILIAEDEPAVRAVVKRILDRAGYHVVAVENGEAACVRAADEPFHLVILDVVMPGMTCQVALERLKVLLPEARFLLSSGYTAETNVAALLSGAAHDLLRKPYDPDRLLRAVRRVLDGSARGAESG